MDHASLGYKDVSGPQGPLLLHAVMPCLLQVGPRSIGALNRTMIGELAMNIS